MYINNHNKGGHPERDKKRTTVISAKFSCPFVYSRTDDVEAPTVAILVGKISFWLSG